MAPLRRLFVGAVDSGRGGDVGRHGYGEVRGDDREIRQHVRALGGDLAVGGGIGSSAALNARADGDALGGGAQVPPVIKPLTGGTDCQLDDVAFIGVFARSLQVMVACADAA